MELIYFTAVAIGLYFLADFVLRGVETWLGRRLEQRSIAFFGIMLVLALPAFAFMRQILGP